MKKTNLFLLLFVSFALNTFAQEIQLVDTTKWLCTYNYDLIQDSTNSYSKRNVQMYLQIGSHVSKFQCLTSYIGDSVMYHNQGVDLETEAKLFAKSVSSAVPNIMALYNIFKNFPGRGLMIFTDYADHKFYKVEQPLQMNWKLDTQKDTVILGYTCQRAFLSYCGRDYIAWYTPQIPVADGPYKFNGLPGLILKVGDTKNQHCFTLTSIKKLDYIRPITFYLSNFIDITAEEYIKIMKTKMIMLFGSVQNGTIPFNSEEEKSAAMSRMRTKNNFLEKF
jgi:GLPGLI family protein